MRREISSTWLVPLSALYSARLARPSHTFLTTVMPSSSTQSFEPVSGCSKREECVFHAPKSKSKSCCPSLKTAFCFTTAGFTFVWATADKVMDKNPHKSSEKYRSIFLTHIIYLHLRHS